ncbi:MMPL family transporter [Phytohabitans suffuscus]|uniref:Membrane protein n=1 Tax=Phytohabitans suffuscus TaxID=624315 RepID=A0A6F8YF57_9ACTN|nr:MMPL family transporter [Phytohabitans suffuscus]BCB84581.1 membrane protein [Phytohabitans suffuscus]
MATALYRLGRWSYRRRWRVTLLWLVLLALAGVGAATLSRPTIEAFSIPGTESQRAVDLLQQRFPEAGADGAVARVVFAAPAGQRITDPAGRAEVERVVSGLRTAPQVAEVAGPFEAEAVSPDGRVALAQVVYKVPRNDLTDADREALLAVAQLGRDAGLTVEVGGDAAQAPPEQGAGELIGVLVAAIVLTITFGSLLAAGLPLITAVVGVAVSLLVITMASRFVDLNSDTPGLALMLGLAVSIDYALFIGFRYREELRAGGERDEAAGRAVGTAGSAVVFAGLTVIIALAGLAVVNIPILTQIGLAAAFTVAVAVLIALTLLPALLGFVGRRVLGRAGRVAAGAVPEGRPSAGRRWGLLVTRFPWLFAGVCVVALAVLAIPALDIRLGLPDDGSAPADTTQRKAYDLLTEGFGPGFNGPLTVVVDTGEAGSAESAAQLISAAITRLPNVASVSPPVYDQARGNTALMSVVSASAPASAATEDLVDDIRRSAAQLRPQTRADVSVTGQTAIDIDITKRTSETIVPYLAIVVGLAFLLLMVVFRSLLVPLKAVLGFLLSLAATFGALVAVFQWGWLTDQLGLEATGLIMNLIPIMVIGLVFGLAMDYEVFLVSRMREEFTHGSGAVEAVVQGCGRSARVIIAAAVIMIGVFSGFILADAQLTKSFGFALAVAVFFDALVVRMTIVPAVMALFGRAAWWVPSWLGRVLPRIDIEGEGLRRREAMPAQGVALAEGATADRGVERSWHS